VFRRLCGWLSISALASTAWRAANESSKGIPKRRVGDVPKRPSTSDACFPRAHIVDRRALGLVVHEVGGRSCRLARVRSVGRPTSKSAHIARPISRSRRVRSHAVTALLRWVIIRAVNASVAFRRSRARAPRSAGAARPSGSQPGSRSGLGAALLLAGTSARKNLERVTDWPLAGAALPRFALSPVGAQRADTPRTRHRTIGGGAVPRNRRRTLRLR
jgi:hypothetical protein